MPFIHTICHSALQGYPIAQVIIHIRIAALLLVFSTACSPTQSLVGSWQGSLDFVEGANLFSFDRAAPLSTDINMDIAEVRTILQGRLYLLDHRLSSQWGSIEQWSSDFYEMRWLLDEENFIFDGGDCGPSSAAKLSVELVGDAQTGGTTEWSGEAILDLTLPSGGNCDWGARRIGQGSFNLVKSD